jgi:hypothetical protein
LVVGRDLRLAGPVFYIQKYFLKSSYPLPSIWKIFTLIYFSQMTEGVWTSSYCLNVEGFPKLLYATMQRLGIKGHPEYEGREYIEHETEQCEVTVYVGKSEDFPDIAEAWSIVMTGFRFCRYISSCRLQSLEVPVPNLREAHCPYTHEILSTPRNRLTSLEDPHGHLAGTLFTRG